MKESQLNPQVALSRLPIQRHLRSPDLMPMRKMRVGNASATARAQDVPLHHAFSLTYKNAINPRVTNGAITVSAEMRFPRWLVWLWPFSSSGISAVSRS
jgi:hypothetical protein